MPINKEQLFGLLFADVDFEDHPDYCDAYICEAWIEENGVERELTDEELQEVNEDSQFVYDKLIEQLF